MSLIKDILDFFFPRHCLVCDTRLSVLEKHICLSCLAELPRTYSHLAPENPVEQLFWGRIPIEKAVSFYFYESQDVRNTIWAFKYKSQPMVGKYLAQVYASEIKPSEFFEGIDAIVAIPLAMGKYLRRGYNQCDYIAEGISEETGIPIIKGAIKRTKNNTTQTHLDRQERLTNVDGIFKLVHPELLMGKHILIIDDVLTTGATICSMANTIMEAGDVKFSVLTLALAGPLKGTPFPRGNGIISSTSQSVFATC